MVDGKLVHNAAMLGVDDELYTKMFPALADDSVSQRLANVLSDVKWSNAANSTEAYPEETVDEIRRNAPEERKLGGRLVTSSDWRYFVVNRFRESIVDCVCQNNWGYVSTFYRWLYNLGVQNHDAGNYYLNRSRIAKYDYKWSDAADCNNVYLWLKTKNGS